MPRRKGQVRFGWRNLSPAYRTRLERGGITQIRWEQGADIRRAAGKKTTSSRFTKNQQVLVDRAVNSDLTPTELRRFISTSKLTKVYPTFMTFLESHKI